MEAQHPQRGVFDVVLLAADGREQNITLHVSPKGVTLAAMDKVLHQFTPETVRKCVPAIARSRRPGGADCVDLVVLTSRGTRELRMRCTAGAADVQSILQRVAVDIVHPKGTSRGSSRTSSHAGARSAAGSVGGSNAKGFLQPPHSHGSSMRTTTHSEVLLSDEPLVSRRVPTVRFPRRGLQELMATAAATAVRTAHGDLPTHEHKDAPEAQASELHACVDVELDEQAAAAAALADTATHTPGMHSWELAAEEAGAVLDDEESDHGRSSGTQERLPQPAHKGSAAENGPKVDWEWAAPQEQRVPHGETEEGPGHDPLSPHPPAAPTRTPPRRHAGSSSLGGENACAAEGSAAAADTAMPPTRRTTSQIDVRAHSDFQLQLLKQEAAASKAGMVFSPNGMIRALCKRGGGGGSSSGANEPRTSSWGTSAGGISEGAGQLAEENAALMMEVTAGAEKVASLEATNARMASMLGEWARESLSTANECVGARAARAAAEQRVEALLAALEELQGADEAAREAGMRADAADAELREAAGQAAAKVNNLPMSMTPANVSQLAKAAAQQRAALECAERAAAGAAAREHELSSAVDSLRGELAAALRAAEEANAGLAEERRARAEDGRIADATHKSWKQEHLVQRAELLEATRRLTAGLEEQARLQSELDALRDAHTNMRDDADGARALAEELRGELDRTSVALAGYQAEDGAVREALAVAEHEAREQRHVCEQALQGQAELRREIEVQRERLSSVRTAAREHAQAEMQVLVEVGHAELAASRAETEAVAERLSQETAASAQLRADVAALEAQITELRDELEEAHAEGRRLGGMSLSAMGKIQALEAERDELLSRAEAAEAQASLLAGMRDAMEGAMQDERGTVEAYASSMRDRLEGAERRALSAADDARELRHRLQVAEKELEIARLSNGRLEDEVAHATLQMRERHESEMRHAAAQLESTLQICHTAMAEAESKLAAKDAMLAQWKEEAKAIGTNLEAALGEHRREQEELVAELDDARATAQALSLDKQRLMATLTRLGDAAVGDAAQQLRGCTQPLSARGAAAGTGWPQPQPEWHARLHGASRLSSVRSSPMASARGEPCGVAEAMAGSPLKPDSEGSPVRRTVSVLAVSPESVAHI